MVRGSRQIFMGATLGATVNFALGRYYCRRWVRSYPGLLDYLNKMQFVKTWPTIFLIRMFAGFTFDWYSYLLGALGTRWVVFVSATALGITLGTFIEAYAGGFLLHRPWVTLLISVAITAISALMSLIVLPRLRTGCTSKAPHARIS